MRKAILLFLLSALPLAFAGSVTKHHAAVARQTIAGGGSGAPAWGTYGTGTGEILFAWDGSSSSGNTVGYDDTESEVSGTLNGGATISGSGADAYLVLNADEERLTFSHAIDTDNPITVCVEFQIDTNSANQAIFEISESSANYVIGQVRGNETVRSGWRTGGGGVSYSANSSGSVSDDGTTWNDVMFSTRIDAGNDQSASSNGSTYDSETDNDVTALASSPTVIEIGNNFIINDTTEKRIRRFAIISGWQQSVPW